MKKPSSPTGAQEIVSVTVDPAALAVVCAMLRFPMPLGLRGIVSGVGELTESAMERAALSLIKCGGVRRRRQNAIEFDAVMAMLLHQAASAERVYSLSLVSGNGIEERLLYVNAGMFVLQMPTDSGLSDLVGLPDHARAMRILLEGTHLQEQPAGTGQAFSLTADELREARIASLDAQSAGDSLELSGVPRREAQVLGSAVANQMSQGKLVVYDRLADSGPSYSAGVLLTWLASPKGVWCSPDVSLSIGRITLEPISGPALVDRLVGLTDPAPDTSDQIP